MSEHRIGEVFDKAERGADPNGNTWWVKGSGSMSWDQIPGMAELLIQQLNEQSSLSAVHAEERIRWMAAHRRRLNAKVDDGPSR